MKRARTSLISTIIATAVALLLPTGAAFAQTSQSSGRVVPAATVPILLAIAGDDATVTPIEGTDQLRLRMRGTDNDLTWFTDKPVRRTGHMHVSDLVNEWPRIFRAQAPTSALIMRSEGVTTTFVVELTKPSFANGVLAFTIEPIVAAHGAIPSNATDVDVMIDDAKAVLPRNPAHHPRITHADHLEAGKAWARQISPRVAPFDATSTDGASDPNTATAPSETPAPAPTTDPASTTPNTPAPTPPSAPVQDSAVEAFNLDPSRWVFHSIVIPPSDDNKYIAKTRLDRNSIQTSDNYIFSMPAIALVGGMADHHLDVINYGVNLVRHTPLDLTN